MSVPGLCARFMEWAAPLLEARCPVCALPVTVSPGAFRNGGRIPLCAACAAALARREGGFCPRCGELASREDAPAAPCGACLTATRPWKRLYFHGSYSGLLREVLLRFKNGHELSLARLLGGLLAAHPDITGPYDAVIPMPLHPRRLGERGFNQALELAKPLAERHGVPLPVDRLIRTGHTRPQAGLSLAERARNVRGMFAAGNVADRRLLLVDDIATTCATLDAAAVALHDAGAARVDVAVMARTPAGSAR